MTSKTKGVILPSQTPLPQRHFFFLLPAIPVIMIQVPSTVPKIKMIFYTRFLYTEDETKTCLQEINKNNGLSQVMLRSTVYI